MRAASCKLHAPMSIVVLISGRGTNLQALLDAAIPVSAVLSNNAQASGLAIAARHGVPTEVIPHRDFPTREAFEHKLAEAVDRHQPKLVVLAGFMRVLTPWFVGRYAGRLINVHPSLLPAFAGLSTHERALAAGVKLHGCTVHFVTAAVDHGPIIAQAAIAVRAADTPESLAARVLVQEHLIYPRAVKWFLEDRLSSREGVVTLKGGDAQFLFDDA